MKYQFNSPLKQANNEFVISPEKKMIRESAVIIKN